MRRSEIQTRLRSWYGRWYFITPDFILGPTSCSNNQTKITTSEELATKLLAIARPDLRPESLGAVYINGKLSKYQQQLNFPFKIEIYAKEPSAEEGSKNLGTRHLPIIIEDNQNFVVTFKPSGLPTLPLRDAPNWALSTELSNELQQPLHFPSRLDTDTQGLVIAGKSKSSSKLLHRLFAEHRIKKFYLARVQEKCSWQELECAAPIGRSLVSPAMRSVWGYAGAQAHTRFWNIAADKNGTLLLCQPITGRTHQIRVHLKYLGYNLIGDRLYNSSSNNLQQLNLLAYSLMWPNDNKSTSANNKFIVPESLFPDWLTHTSAPLLSGIPDFIESQLNIES